MIYLVIRHASRTDGIPVDDVAEGELRSFSAERRLAMWLQGIATLLGTLLPFVAVLIYLSVSVFFIAEPFRLTLRRAGRR